MCAFFHVLSLGLRSQLQKIDVKYVIKTLESGKSHYLPNFLQVVEENEVSLLNLRVRVVRFNVVKKFVFAFCHCSLDVFL